MHPLGKVVLFSAIFLLAESLQAAVDGMPGQQSSGQAQISVVIPVSLKISSESELSQLITQEDDGSICFNTTLSAKTFYLTAHQENRNQEIEVIWASRKSVNGKNIVDEKAQLTYSQSKESSCNKKSPDMVLKVKNKNQDKALNSLGKMNLLIEPL